jgi:hypothetical protein
LPDNPYTAFIVVSTAITVLFVLLRLIFKLRILLWKSTLISYIIFFVFTLMSIAYEHSQVSERAFQILYVIMLAPGMIIQALFFGGGPCLSGNHVEFNILTFAFLFYTIVIWGIMRLIKKSKEPVAAENKQDDNVEKQTPTETDA